MGIFLYLKRGPAEAPLSERSQAGRIRNRSQRVEEMRRDLEEWENSWSEAGIESIMERLIRFDLCFGIEGRLDGVSGVNERATSSM